jgi:putative hydrolase of the HAD superfamily
MVDLVALDADDTLWHNESLYTSTREQFRALIARYESADLLDDRLYEIELRNLQHFGYGVNGFVLSMIESAIELTNGRLVSSDVRTIVEWGREMVCCPVEVFDGVQETLEELADAFPLILVTKGDLLHQESKLARSGLGHLFKGLEVVSEKDARVYQSVMARHEVEANHFVMVGNSLRSDILPVLESGGHAVYVPYELSWVHERVPADAVAASVNNPRFHEIAQFRELPALLHRLESASRAV